MQCLARFSKTAAFSHSATSPNPARPFMLLLMLLLSVDLAPPGTRLNTGDSFKSKTDVDNKRHTNAHQPLTSPSPMGVSIPPLRQKLYVTDTTRYFSNGFPCY